MCSSMVGGTESEGVARKGQGLASGSVPMWTHWPNLPHLGGVESSTIATVPEEQLCHCHIPCRGVFCSLDLC